MGRETERIGGLGRGGRRPMYVGLGLAMVLGLAVYLRLWSIDYSISADDTELLRRQFDLANREAMDESAEWRLKYDKESERAKKCGKELRGIKHSFEKEIENAAGVNQKLATLQKENIDLLERMEALKQELEAEKLKCNSV